MSSYSDEDLYMHYRPYATDSETAQRIVSEHRALYPLTDPASGWEGMSADERDAAALAAIKRAAASVDAGEKEALVALALDGARARVESVKGKR